MNVRRYRNQLYRLQSHPENITGVADSRDSFARVYLSLVPFLFAEYLIELHVRNAASGMIFPLGYLLFWAFYYTYYRPGYLEARLSHSGQGSLAEIPKIFFGLVIWFVKITFVELFQLLTSWIFDKPAPPPVRPRLVYSRAAPGGAETRSKTSGFSAANQRSAPRKDFPPRQAPPPTPPQPPPLPGDVTAALRILGLGDCRDWKLIHHRYRELAKRYHPDLNPEITEAGTRFMRFDSAYKKLESVRVRYFK